MISLNPSLIVVCIHGRSRNCNQELLIMKPFAEITPLAQTAWSRPIWLWRNFGYEGYRYPYFVDWGVPSPHFSGRKGENVLSPAVNRDNLKRLIQFSTRAPPGPHWESSRRSPRPQSRMRRGYFLPILLPHSSGPKGALFSLWIGTPTF